MSRPPRYAPKSRYRTRQSGAEVEDATHLADTAIDRLVPNLEELQAARAAAQSSPPTPRPLRWLPLAIVVVVVIALGIGAVLATVLFLGG